MPLKKISEYDLLVEFMNNQLNFEFWKNPTLPTCLLYFNWKCK